MDVERAIAKHIGGLSDPVEDQRLADYLLHLEQVLQTTERQLFVTEAQNKRLDENMNKVTVQLHKDAEMLQNMVCSNKVQLQ